MTRILLRGGYVHAPGDPHASAVCVDGGEIVWTGDDDASAHFVDNADRVVELEGRLVTPAFVDAHAHLALTGLAALGVDLTPAHSVQDALHRLDAHARTHPGEVILGHGWDESRWPEGRVFTRDELDRAVGHRVAYVARVDAHSSVVSSRFLDRAPAVVGAEGYDAAGRVERDAHHAARTALFRLIPGSTREQAIASALADAAAHGVGMVHELGAPHISPPEDFARIDALPGPRPEVVGYWGELGAVGTARELGCSGAAGDLCVDGALGSRTAALLAPYDDDPETSGHLYLEAEQVAEHLVACTEAGLQAGFHVIGDRAAAEVMAGFARAADLVGVPALVRGRHRLEHLEMVDADQMRLLGELGVTASVQPLFDALWGGPGALYAGRLGAVRAGAMNPFASLNRAGVALAFGSDSPVTPVDPWAAVRAAAHHHDPAERVTARAAFNAHTRGGWRAARRDEGGVLALGAPASLAVWEVPGELLVQTPDARVAAWSTDPRAGVPRLPDLHPDVDLPRCTLTLVRGEVCYDPAGALR